MGQSKRIKYARQHLSHKRYLQILATPNWRRTQTYDPNILPNAFEVPKPALKAKLTRRIRKLARPKSFHVVHFHIEKSPSRRHARPTASAQEDLSGRILDLAVPKKSILVSARSYGIHLRNSHLVANINGQLRLLKKSRYRKYRMVCNVLAKRAAVRERRIRKKLFRAVTKPAEWEKLKVKIEALAKPKPIKKPPSPDRGPKVAINAGHLNVLATPVKSKARPPKREGVAPGALVYEITDRILKLSVRENPPQDPPYNEPGKVVPEALTAVASKRTAELAEPSHRPPGLETDVNVDAFTVVPAALKAYCSPRTRQLAIPKKRR